MEVLLASFAIGAAGAAAEGIVRCFKRRRVDAGGLPEPSEAGQGCGAAEDDASTNSAAAGNNRPVSPAKQAASVLCFSASAVELNVNICVQASRQQGLHAAMRCCKGPVPQVEKTPAAPVTPAAAATGTKLRSQAGAGACKEGAVEKQEVIVLLDSDTEETRSDGGQRRAAAPAANPAAASVPARRQQGVPPAQHKRKHAAGNRDVTAGQNIGGVGLSCSTHSDGHSGGQLAAAGAGAFSGSLKLKRRRNRELKLLQPFSWDK